MCGCFACSGSRPSLSRAPNGTWITRGASRAPVDKSLGVRSDQTIVLSGQLSREHYPEPLRRVSYYDQKQQRKLVFLTNNFTLPALTIAELYRCRWQIELFFKWIKQNLHITAFYGHSDNAVKTQVWVAVSVYVLVAILKKELQSELSLSDLLQILDVNIFEKTPLLPLLTPKNNTNQNTPAPNQLLLFDL